MRCLTLSDAIERAAGTTPAALAGVGAAVSPCGKHAAAGYASEGATTTAAEIFDITAGHLVSVLTIPGTVDYNTLDVWTDDEWNYLYVLDTLRTAAGQSIRLRNFPLRIPSATAIATLALATGVANVASVIRNNAVGGAVTCDKKYTVIAYITTIGAGGPPTTGDSTTTVNVVDALTLVSVATFTFAGRTNHVEFAKVSCGSKKACTYVVFGSASDIGSSPSVPTIIFAAPAYLNVYKLSVSGATAAIHKQKKLPQYALDISVSQPLKRGVAAKIWVGTRLTIKSTTAPSPLVTVTNNLVLSTDLCDTAELREYLLTPKKCKLVSARKVLENVHALDVDHTGNYLYTEQTFGTSGAGVIVGYVQNDVWQLVELTHAGTAPNAEIAVANSGKYLLVVGGIDATLRTVELFRSNCDKKCC